MRSWYVWQFTTITIRYYPTPIYQNMHRACPDPERGDYMVTGQALVDFIIKINRVFGHILPARLDLPILKIFKPDWNDRQSHGRFTRTGVKLFLPRFLFLSARKLPVAKLQHNRYDNCRTYC